MAPAPPTLPFSPTTTSSLSHTSALLHLFHHRNKNQHRRSHWYRHFSLLRRHLAKLLSDNAILQFVPDTFAARHRKKASNKPIIERMRARLDFWARVLLPRCSAAFGQVVADGRFAQLGVFLLGAIGEVGKLTGTLEGKDLGDEDDSEKRSDESNERKLEAGANQGKRKAPSASSRDGGQGKDEDLGEVIARNDVAEDEVDAQSATASSPRKATVEILAEKNLEPDLAKKKVADEPPKKKRKKRKNAIDDLFGNL